MPKVGNFAAAVILRGGTCISMNKMVFYLTEDALRANVLMTYLKNERIDMTVFNELEELSAKTPDIDPCLILMDEDTEKRGWTDRLRMLREKSKAPIGLLLDKDDVMTRITALSLGADIRLKKDIQAVELIALIKAIIRRRELEIEDRGVDELSFGDLRLCRSEHTAFSGDKPLGLTPNEFDFLIYMMEQGRAVTKEELLREVWKTDDSYLLVNVTGDLVKRLRKKLRKVRSNVYVAAVWGYGYRLEQRTSDIDKSA